jgi:hypothetical protein
MLAKRSPGATPHRDEPAARPHRKDFMVEDRSQHDRRHDDIVRFWHFYARMVRGVPTLDASPTCCNENAVSPEAADADACDLRRSSRLDLGDRDEHFNWNV